jgi:excisionase family DNA binding protein
MEPAPDSHDHDTTERTIMAAPLTRLWTVQDVSTYLGIPVMTLYHWRRSGYGPKGKRIGRHLRYRAEDVRAWVDAQDREAG